MMARFVVYKLLYSLAAMAAMTTLIVVLSAVMTGAAWFALGSDTPPVPWFIIRFFLFIGWVIAGVGGLCLPVSQTQEDKS